MPVVHASCVAVAGRALLIQGPSGSGKSGLALDLMSRGAHLVADDRVMLESDGQSVIASAPETIRGLIEARGIGLLSAQPTGPVPLCAVVDLTSHESDRLPPFRKVTLCGIDLPLLHNSASAYFAAGLMQYLKGDRRG